MLSYLNIPDKITFGDELISILICFIKKTKKISDIEWEIFNHLPVIQASQNNELHGLFKLVNQYIIHGKEHLQDSPHKIQQILDMAGKGMFASHKGKVRESSNSEGALIYQLMLFDYGGFIDHHLEQIYSNTFLRYLQNVNHDFFKVRLLGIILAGITYNPQLSFAILVRNTTPQGISYLRFSLIQIINHSTLFAHSYDKRLAVIGICNLLNQPNLPTDVSELISQIFEALIIILSLKMSDGEAQVKEKQKSPIDALMETLFDSDEENDFENDIVVKGTKLLYGNSSESGVNKSEEIEANLLLSYVNSPIQSLDEYDYFRRTLAEIKSHNPDLIKHLASNLSPQRRDQLLEIVQCQRVQINNLPGENTVVRKIVKAKHR